MGFRSVVGGCIAALAFVGCGGSGDGLDRQAVSGMVILDGQPLAKGRIQFLPTEGQPVAAGASIVDGNYQIPGAEGPVPGSYRVTISSAEDPPEPSDQDEAPGGMGRVARELIPAKYNVNSALDAKIQAGDTAPRDFTLTSK